MKAKIKRAAGSIAYGWAIWNLRGVYFEAEHHGVWEKRSGELVDLTPQMNGYKKILFLPDPGAPYNPQTFRSNRMSADGDNPVALRFVEKSLQRNRIIDSYRGVGVEQTYLTPNDQRKVDDLLQELQELLTELLASR
ncbi:MAG: hypothetical protein V2I43_17095 [Parvularcula sp.]|nr:hypothetical protein [Parvularcula sp.]